MSDEPYRDPIVIMPEAQASLNEIVAKHPKAADDIRDFMAILRQAQQGLKDGKYASFDEAMEALTGKLPERIDIGDTT